MRRLLLVAAVLAGLSRPAAGQDPSGPWRTLHTAHFRIHFRAPARAMADRAAAEAERAYALLSSELKAPRGTVDLVLADNVDAANGFASVFPSNTVTLFTTPPVLEPGLEAHDDWLRLVTVHELAHVFHLDRAGGFWGALQRVFGRGPGLFPNLYQPSWVSEGLATYYESRFTTSGRVAGSFHTQVLSADAAAGRFRRPWDAVLFSAWPDGTMPYAYGSRFFAHLADAVGDTVVPAFAAATSGQLIPWRVGRPLRRVAGNQSLEARWAEAAPDSAAPVRQGEGREVVARGLYQSPRPRLSDDGRRLAYLHDDGRSLRRVMVVDLHTGERRGHRVTQQVSFDWMKDQLLVAQLDFTSPYDLRGDLYRWSPGGAWRRLTRGARVVAVGEG
ncbi:MAG: hypothetical protein ACREN5_08630, partial [Gemmatimonadales bacterium]